MKHADAAAFAAARAHLVTQLAQEGSYARDVLDAMAAVPRHAFVAAAQAQDAYVNAPLPIGEAQTISQPAVVAHMLSALRLGRGDKVLEIGAGSGYAAAVLAQMGCKVVALEVRPALAERARATLAASGYDQVEVVVDDAAKGWAAQAPYAGILVSCAAPRVPDVLLQQLDENGLLAIPVGADGAVQQLERWQRRGDAYRQETLGAVRFVPWVDARQLAKLQAAR